MAKLPAAAKKASPPSAKAERKPKPRAITKKVRDAIDFMVWEGLPRDEAAEKAKISPHGLYKAFRGQHVRRHYRDECEVLRTSGRARRIHRLEQIADQDDNLNAAVYAIRHLDRIDDEAPGGGGEVTRPGLVIVIEGAPAAAVKVLEHQARPLPAPASMGSRMGAEEDDE